MKFKLLILLIPFLLVACKSKEERAEDLISKELYKTLYDYDSYSPIETIVKEAKESAFNDTTCIYLIYAFKETYDDLKESVEEAGDALEYRDIWGKPTYYSSSYSDKQYYKYNGEFLDAMKNVSAYKMEVYTLSEEIKKVISLFDSTKIVGWEVVHRFRCKTRGGDATIGNYRFLIDQDMTNIFFEEDMDDDDYESLRSLFETIKEGGFDYMKE